jgi:hypothetical protein
MLIEFVPRMGASNPPPAQSTAEKVLVDTLTEFGVRDPIINANWCVLDSNLVIRVLTACQHRLMLTLHQNGTYDVTYM